MGAELIAYPAFAVSPRIAPVEARSPYLRAFIIVCWFLSEVCLSNPGHPTFNIGNIDMLAVAKGVSRAVALAVFFWIVLRTHTQARVMSVLVRCTPLMMFGLWTLATCIWSPIKSISLGHATEAFMLGLLSIAAGIVYRSELDLEQILRQMVLIITVLMVVLLALNIQEIKAGLRPMNFMQPNNLAGIASIGLLTLLLSRLLWDWRWTHTLMWPSGLICGLTVFIAQSRSCLIVTSIIALPVLWAMYKKHLVLFGLIVAGFVAAFLPYSASISKAPDAVMSYIMRGQSAEDAYTVSGRTEVWDIAVKAFWEAPLFGHGYYSMTSTGTMYVWGAERWQTAHNTYLHVLTGTGVMGYALLIWALLYILQPAWIYVRRPVPERKLAVFILLLVAWYMCLGCFELSFAGPVDPEVVLFFIVLGLSAGLGAHARTRLT